MKNTSSPKKATTKKSGRSHTPQPEILANSQRVRAIARLFREFAVKPESPASVLASHQGEWFKSPYWRALVDENLKALYAGNPTRLRRELETSPTILADPVMQAILVQLWGLKFLKTPEGVFARKVLKALFHNLWDTLGAPEHETQAERDEAKRKSYRKASKQYYSRNLIK
jgi:hypothetical protein